jgi:hypothetical protein
MLRMREVGGGGGVDDLRCCRCVCCAIALDEAAPSDSTSTPNARNPKNHNPKTLPNPKSNSTNQNPDCLRTPSTTIANLAIFLNQPSFTSISSQTARCLMTR